jgi:flap endonuclease-1
MGVDNFFKIKVNSDTTVEDLGQEIKLKDLKDQRVCIDTSMLIYSSILAMDHLGTLTDSEGRPTAHINTIFNKIIQLQECGIAQVWVFDSPQPNELKKRALEMRAERRKVALEKRYKNHEKTQFRLGKEQVEDIQYLLRKMGVCYIVAPPGIEAEQYGAYMTRGPKIDRYCNYMLSGDSDVLCFGGNLLRMSSRKSATGNTRKTVYHVYELDTLLAQLELTYTQFLQVCVTLGTDFAQGTQGVGPGSVIKRVKADSLDISPRQELVMEYYASDITDKIGEAEIVQEEFDREAVVDFLKERNFNEERVRSRLSKYKVLEEQS